MGKGVGITPQGEDFPNLDKNIVCAEPVEYFKLYFDAERSEFLTQLFMMYEYEVQREFLF